jgi:hypothetical protein
MTKRNARLIAVLGLLVAAAVCAFAQDMIVKSRRYDGTTQRIGYTYPLPTAEVPLVSFSRLATQTLSVATTAVALPVLTDLDDPTRVLRMLQIGAIGGAANLDNASVTTDVTPFTIASGSYQTFPIGSNTLSVYAVCATPTTSVTLHFRAW